MSTPEKMQRPVLSALERLARAAWEEWGAYAQWAICSVCGEWRYCRARRRGDWLCLGCFDQRTP